MQEEYGGLEKMLNNTRVAATTNLNELIRFNVETLCRCFALESSRNSIANRPVCATAGLSTLPHAAHVFFSENIKGQNLLAFTTCKIHREAKKEPFSFVCVSLVFGRNWVNFFMYIRENISYTYVYLILACVKNFV